MPTPEIRSLFLATDRYAYLNSAAVSPIPLPAGEAVGRQLVDVARNGSVHFNDWVDTKDRCRKLLAGMLAVEPQQVAFLRNTSDSMASIANGIDWKAGDNIVSFAEEFPANFYPWRRIRDEFGVELRLAPANANGGFDHDELIALIDANTRVVTISAVQYATGYRADLRRIGEAARAVDALFCVDVIQGLGAMPFDLPRDLVDAAAGASHKWLCAPEGCGFLYLSDRARSRVKPTLTGWISMEEPWDFADREQAVKKNALAWESGTNGSALFYGLEQSLIVLTTAGIENIANHIARLTDRLCDRLPANYDVVSARTSTERSHIVSIRHRDGIAPSRLAKDLEEQDVIVSPRGEFLRIAPHLYNNEQDIDRLIDALP
jgi:cysteine desulfurase / selenocysteine lyase